MYILFGLSSCHSWSVIKVNSFSSCMRNTLYIIIIIMSRRLRGYPWPSLAISPYHSSPPAGLQDYNPCPHIAAVCKFVLVAPHLHIHEWGSTGVHRLWARPCFSSSVPRVWFVELIYIYIHIYIYIYVRRRRKTTSYIYICRKNIYMNWSFFLFFMASDKNKFFLILFEKYIIYIYIYIYIYMYTRRKIISNIYVWICLSFRFSWPLIKINPSNLVLEILSVFMHYLLDKTSDTPMSLTMLLINLMGSLSIFI